MATGTLTSTTIASTYKSLLKLGAEDDGEDAAANTELHATNLKMIEDGHGNNSCIRLAQNRVEIVPEANHANAFEVSQADGTQIFNIASDTPALIVNAATVTLTQDTNFVTSGGTNGMSIDGTTFSVDGSSNFVGIGVAAPDRRLHIMESDASKAPTNSDSILIVEKNADTFIEVMTPASNIGGILFSDGAQEGWVTYNHSTRALGFGSGASTKMSVMSDGKVGIGTASPDGILELSKDGADTDLILTTYGDEPTEYPQIFFRKADNTEADPDLISDNDPLGVITFSGMDADSGGSFIAGAHIIARAAATPAADDMPADLEFWTNDGVAAPEQRMTIVAGGTVDVVGELTAGTKTFKIDHPLPGMKDSNYLLHSCVEAPKADLIYRGKVDLVSGGASINIDTEVGMTDGTFVLLCDDVQCFTTNESNWDKVKGSVSGNVLTIESENTDSTASISWMVIGDRKDEKIINALHTDENGKFILEPLKIEHDNA